MAVMRSCVLLLCLAGLVAGAAPPARNREERKLPAKGPKKPVAKVIPCKKELFKCAADAVCKACVATLEVVPKAPKVITACADVDAWWAMINPNDDKACDDYDEGESALSLYAYCLYDFYSTAAALKCEAGTYAPTMAPAGAPAFEVTVAPAIPGATIPPAVAGACGICGAGCGCEAGFAGCICGPQFPGYVAPQLPPPQIAGGV